MLGRIKRLCRLAAEELVQDSASVRDGGLGTREDVDRGPLSRPDDGGGEGSEAEVALAILGDGEEGVDGVNGVNGVSGVSGVTGV